MPVASAQQTPLLGGVDAQASATVAVNLNEMRNYPGNRR
jgi:hypothetical protein